MSRTETKHAILNLYETLERDLRRNFRDTDLIIVDKGRDIEIILGERIDFATVKRIDRVLKSNLKAIVFTKGAKIVVKIEKGIKELEAQKEQQESADRIPIKISRELEEGDCFMCYGDGYIVINSFTCIECQGTGKAKPVPPKPKPEPKKLGKGRCDVCQGTGKFIDNLGCYKCKATGYKLLEPRPKKSDWDWKEPEGTEIKYYVLGIEIDLNHPH